MNTFTLTNTEINTITLALENILIACDGVSEYKDTIKEAKELIQKLNRPKEKRVHSHIIGKPTTFSISAEAPETFDQAGFDALEFTEISEVIRSKEK